MSVTAELWLNREELVQSFHLATIYGILGTWRRCERLKTTPQEPDFVAGLVTESTPLIHSALNALLSPRGISVSMCAVFCHQKPEVTFSSHPSGSCELGDILFAYIHTQKNGAQRRNALLFQAKSSAQQPYRIHRGEANQLKLYTDWPDFEYKRSSIVLNGHKRTVTPKTPHAGAQYLLIDDSLPSDPRSGLLGFPETYPVGCYMPDELLRDHSRLADELFNLLIFRSGRPFEDKNAARKTEDWSQVVWDLLEIGVKKSFQRKNSGRYYTPRSAGDTLAMLDGTVFARASSRMSYSTASDIVGQYDASIIYAGKDDVPPDYRNRENDFREPEAGVSVVLIETSEQESEG